MRAWKWHEWLGAIAIVGFIAWLLYIFYARDSERHPIPSSLPAPPPAPSGQSVAPGPVSSWPTAAEALLAGYGDASSPPLEDLRKLLAGDGGVFSVVKDGSRNLIGGNQDLGSGPAGRQSEPPRVPAGGATAFSSGHGRIVDRRGSPLMVHPEAWRVLELRSAGPDRTAYTADDVVLPSNGLQPTADGH